MILLFSSIAPTICSFLWFHKNFRIVSFILMKNATGITLMGIVYITLGSMNLYITLGSMNISTILFFQSKNMGYLSISFSSISFINVLKFSVHRSYISLIKFVSKYFSAFYTIVNNMAFLISFLGSLLLVCRNATDFCMFILLSAN